MLCRLLLLSLFAASPVRADDVAGEFDYYVMALSWSANWCEMEGDERGSPQCAPSEDFGWVLHGLWPQYERGWPSDCRTSERNPSRAETSEMAWLFGSSGSAWHQWNKHGTCTGLSAPDFYLLAGEAYDRVSRPEVFRRLERSVRLPAEVVEEAFLRDNPELSPDGVTVTCRSGYIQEVRICLTRDLEFRDCAADTRADCTLDDALFEPMR
ncbi:ribonuclease T2 family protein [Pelagovum pacificum]|uniref:Ribonuclease T n=1 Tax=Pelagovum pacificum TaxID=2588711 RepID=A0A5C5GDG8_9RHOB|nr:ribonuclease T2 [Pelagovum pacificum]QQA42505.1 ribonuclease T2 [Pelagovum pacificum]TNY31589.1 ribonuclease T [Pelagovum pacificum]